MPLYEYICKDCKNQFEELVFSQDAHVSCPQCGSENTEKLMSACASKTSNGLNFDALQDSGCGSGG